MGVLVRWIEFQACLKLGYSLFKLLLGRQDSSQLYVAGGVVGSLGHQLSKCLGGFDITRTAHINIRDPDERLGRVRILSKRLLVFLLGFGIFILLFQQRAS